MDEDEGPPLSVEDAVETIHRATGFTLPLRRRTEGVTMALWGLVTAVTILVSGILEWQYGWFEADDWRTLALNVFWMPILGVGVLLTLAVWRIAEARVGRKSPGRRRSPAVLLTGFVVLTAVAVLLLADVGPGGGGVAIIVVGLIWLAIALADVYRATPEGRRSMFVIGGTIVALGTLYLILAADLPHRGWEHFTAVGAGVLGSVPLVAGLVQALRG